MKKEESTIQNERANSEKLESSSDKPKTGNNAFENISAFLEFFENRRPEIKELSNKFKEMEDRLKRDSSEPFDDEIRLKVLEHLNNMSPDFQPNPSSQNTPVPGPDQTEKQEEASQKIKKSFDSFFWNIKIKRKNDYVILFKKPFQSLKEFYERILLVYTMVGLLKFKINEYLRNENWGQLDYLLVYTYCLFKAFQWGPTGLEESFAKLKSNANKDNNILTLYRGVYFDQETIDFYSGQTKEFSWNGVTSTSLDESQARHYLRNKNSVKKPVLTNPLRTESININISENLIFLVLLQEQIRNPLFSLKIS